NEAMDRQWFVLDRMIEFGYATQEEAKASFDEYWANYDYTRASVAAYYSREDAAPWFSEYVRRELEGLMYGAMDYYRDGYTVHTTLDLKQQETAGLLMAQGLEKANREFTASSKKRLDRAEETYIPIVDLLSLYFDMEGVRSTSDAQHRQRSINQYNKTLNPVLDMLALSLGIQEVREITSAGFEELKRSTAENTVEGALIAIENGTGYITALIGGSKYDESNQLIRATQGKVMPGSSFKPLYYSAAIDTRKFTASSLIYDIPIVFHNEDGTPYIPLNFRGEWKGSVLLYYALAQSMNVPSLKILDGIGFDAAIDRASALLGIEDSETKRRTFPRVYPMGLGIISVAPIQIARGFAVFANQGRDVTPMAIRAVEDRNGRIVLDPEREVRQRQKKNNGQVISPQNAYVMTSILKKTVEIGTLANGAGWGAKFTFKDEQGNRYRIPAAGKTGTTQNWSDAWAVGYTPYYTTAIWFGFDKPGNSLGLSLTGSTLAGPIWGDFMREIHQGLPSKDFVKPSSGIVEVTVCAKSGLLRTPSCKEGEVFLPFLEGTQPVQYCTMHQERSGLVSAPIELKPFDLGNGLDVDRITQDLKMPVLRLDLPDLPAPGLPVGVQAPDRFNPDDLFTSEPELPAYNPLLD
ncbi:MAG: penicillin-binding protein, partial [Spirochaetaceae bacterium]|nr:penicillin-binding protein [Spirochaetaceae bacterium]